MTSYKVEKTEKQIEAVRKIARHRVTNLAGGSRSGKTFIALYVIVLRAIKYAGSRHLVARFRFNHAKQAIVHDTMPKLLQILGIRGIVKLNKTDYYYTFPNGSEIWVGGLDDKERVEKILGNEYATVFLNEASQISYDAFETITTRLNPPKDVKGRIIVDYNPPSMSHWGYKLFVKRVYPDGRPVPADDFASVMMNPQDNIANISPDYIKNLESLSAAKRKRFLEGQYGVDDGELWTRSWIKYAKELPDMYRIVVGVDPAGTADGDEIGIIVCGKSKDEFFVLDDFSLNGTPNQWAAEVAAAYHKWGADVIVAEKNYGGDMVESTIKNADNSLNVRLINSSRGKILRAEPISAVYEQGKVYHRTLFNDLEDEMCMYKVGVTESPNRLDAMVFAMTELTGGEISILDVI